jgi:hypothetical protein
MCSELQATPGSLNLTQSECFVFPSSVPHAGMSDEGKDGVSEDHGELLTFVASQLGFPNHGDTCLALK